MNFSKHTKNVKTKLRLLMLTVAIVTVYFILIRPHLMADMWTAPIELTAALILLLSIIILLLSIIIRLLIAVIAAAIGKKQSYIKPIILKVRRRSVVALALITTMAAFVCISQKIAYTPPITKYGKTLKGSIAVMQKVKLNGCNEWITIRGENAKNPVLLFLAGGPGGSQLAATRIELKKLEDHFVVVDWDQPGACKSYDSVPINSITPNRYVLDGYKLAQYLCKRFNKRKIYVVGESWGSALGIMLVHRYPKLFSAFIGTGQMIAFEKTEIYCYKKALKMANERGDAGKTAKLKKQGPPPYYGKDVVWKENEYLQYLSDYMTQNPNIHNPGYKTLQEIAAPEYGLYDKYNYFLSLITTFNHVYPQLYSIDFRKQIKKLDVPVYFMDGIYDVNSSPELAEQYYKLLKAPHKEFTWFKHSGHDVWRNESDKFVNLVVKKLSKNNIK